MPYFRVMLHSHGINVQVEGESRPIVGFYCTRLIKASTVDDAVLKAKEMVLHQWMSDEYATINKGAVPSLNLDSVEEASFFSSLTFKNSGYTFYPEEDKTNI
jgi:hypothetical protein